MNPLFHTEFSISDSLKNVRKSVLIYETIIELEFQYISCCSLSAGKSADEIAKENFNTSHVVVYHFGVNCYWVCNLFQYISCCSLSLSHKSTKI